jgi:hypothetical protein
LNQDVINQAIGYLKENRNYCTQYGCDLHNEIYNMDYFIIGRYQAEQWLIKNVGIFQAIDDIKEYEESNFGEVNTDLSEAEHVCNMWVYIEGEKVLNESKALSDNWDSHLNPEIIDSIIEELENLKTIKQ